MKQKTGRKLLGVLLALAMVVGLMPGMSLTAYAYGNVAKVGETEYATLSAALNAWNDGTTLTLLANVETDSTISMSSGTKTFALNGHNITKTGDSGSVFQVTGGNLTVNGTGTISGGKGMLDPNGVYFRGGGFYISNAEVTVTNATISGNEALWGGGVFVGGTGTFTMNNGTISANKSKHFEGWTSGGGVWIEENGTFIMNGGTVTGNTAEDQIGGVHAFQDNNNNGTFKVSGAAVITGNTHSGSNSNVKGNITVIGTLTEGANIGVTMDSPGVFTNSENTAYNDASKFTSDDTSYAVGKNAADQLYLGTPITVIYKVVNGTWSDDSKGELTETVASGSKPAKVPTGMKPAEGYTGGAWDKDPTAATITEAKTFTYTFTAKQPATVSKAPTAKNPTYNGSAQELVTAGEADGGEMQYVIGTDASTAPTTGYTTSIPTATEAGTYYVWYKAVGDATHTDSDAACVTVTIAAKPAPTEAPTSVPTATPTSVPTATPKPVPKTGDNANPSLWLAMMLVALIGFAGLAVTGTMKASRKKK